MKNFLTSISSRRFLILFLIFCIISITCFNHFSLFKTQTFNPAKCFNFLKLSTSSTPLTSTQKSHTPPNQHPNQPSKLSPFPNLPPNLPKSPNDTRTYLHQSDQFVSYTDHVDFRALVLTHNRFASLQRLLDSLQNLRMDGHTAALEIWIDPGDRKTTFVNMDVYKTATSFSWKHGVTRVHIHSQHVGILGQWIDTWRPGFVNATATNATAKNATATNTSAYNNTVVNSTITNATAWLQIQVRTDEISLFLEDDMLVSSEAFRFLKAVHQKYGGRKDFGGVSINNSPIKAHNTRQKLRAPPNHGVYMYVCIGTWGFSPAPHAWRLFQDWYHEKKKSNELIRKELEKPNSKMNKSALFYPLVDGVVPSKWYRSFLSVGKEKGMWSMWFIYYAHHHKLWTVYSNLGQVLNRKDSNLGVNTMENGLHFFNSRLVNGEKLLLGQWNHSFLDLMPDEPIKYDWEGNTF